MESKASFFFVAQLGFGSSSVDWTEARKSSYCALQGGASLADREIEGAIFGNPLFEWPKIHGFHSGCFTPLSGVISPYFWLSLKGPPCYANVFFVGQIGPWKKKHVHEKSQEKNGWRFLVPGKGTHNLRQPNGCCLEGLLTWLKSEKRRNATADGTSSRWFWDFFSSTFWRETPFDETLQGINISHLGNRKIMFKGTFKVGYVSFLEGTQLQWSVFQLPPWFFLK